MPRDPRETREQLLDTAERLMAEHGPEGVSMREVSVRAGQGNNNAANYHFGSARGSSRPSSIAAWVPSTSAARP